MDTEQQEHLQDTLTTTLRRMRSGLLLSLSLVFVSGCSYKKVVIRCKEYHLGDKRSTFRTACPGDPGAATVTPAPAEPAPAADLQVD